ncbi:MAG TPA: prephenate dehydrogenase/arogenate dehydrogenase family protein [Gemmatales bacterium]|nr:prephenate dehydrogenase/arogenate dehydrogenase family protein [Gemmatales bacterium]
MIETLGIIGVGLLGGSIALAARERRLARRIIGISPNSESLNIADQRGMIDEGSLEITSTLKSAELTIICTPVDRVASIAQSLLQQFPEMIVSDVGSTKAVIVKEMEPAPRFVGGHPMAGSEKSGPEHATADLFQNRLMFLSPTKTTAPTTTTILTRFWQALGTSVIEMDADRHDAIMAMVSHLPHLASYSFGTSVDDDFLQYSGTGLRTMVRLAGGDAAMWTAIAMSNREHLLAGLEQYQTALRQFEHALQAGDATQLHQLFTQGRRMHHALGS